MKEGQIIKYRPYGNGFHCDACGGSFYAPTMDILRDHWHKYHKQTDSSHGLGKGGVKDDGGRARWDLLPWKAVAGVVDVMTFGALKYADDGWRTVPNARARYLAAMMRHLYKMLRGEKYDSDPTGATCKAKDDAKVDACVAGSCFAHTRKRHIDCVATNALFLSELEED